jgi:hypothetical protein
MNAHYLLQSLLDAHARRRATGSTTAIIAAAHQTGGLVVFPTEATSALFDDLLPANQRTGLHLLHRLRSQPPAPILLDNSTVMWVCQTAIEALEFQDRRIKDLTVEHRETARALRRELARKEAEIQRLKTRGTKTIRIRRNRK